ncbi:MAG: DedA family protein [Actinomycetota bacterium]|nr:DedA family protein [Actinomycetota bacterium]
MVLATQETIAQQILEFLRPFFKDWGYLIVFVLALLEHSFLVGLVMPGDVVLLLGSLYAGWGYLNILGVMSLACLGSIIGDHIGYLLGLEVGRPILDRFSSSTWVNSRILKAEKYFEKHGGATVFIARFATVVGSIVPLLGGVSKLRYRVFVKYEIPGSFLWAFGYGFMGFIFGKNMDTILKIINYIGDTILIAMVVIALSAYFANKMRKRKQEKEVSRQAKPETGKASQTPQPVCLPQSVNAEGEKNQEGDE